MADMAAEAKSGGARHEGSSVVATSTYVSKVKTDRAQTGKSVTDLNTKYASKFPAPT
jgi:hypothetical protein